MVFTKLEGREEQSVSQAKLSDAQEKWHRHGSEKKDSCGKDMTPELKENTGNIWKSRALKDKA